jgi:4-amino-4-deoxy-L-arabinose transferase-like glycosyltransferase
MEASKAGKFWQRWPILFAFAIGAICLAMGWHRFPYLAFEPDTAAYVFQARLFASGILAAPAPADFGFSPSPHINIHNGLWAAKYPFGNSLFLTPGILVDFPWLMPALATALSLILFFDIVRMLFDRRTAGVALILAGVSPATVILGATFLSQPTSRLFIAAYLWSLLRCLPNASIAFAATAGLALGYAINTRPVVAAVFGVAGLCLVLATLARDHDRVRLARPAFAFALALAAMMALFLLWNLSLTGDPWLLPYHALQSADRMGFGLRGEGYAPYVVDFRTEFTPAAALDRLWRHTIPGVLYGALGWGSYVPNMLLFDDPARRFPIGALLLPLPALLALLPLVRRDRRQADMFCATIVVLTFAVLFFQYSDHSTWGRTPINSSYYNEAVLFGLLPLVARGVLIVHDAVLETGRRALRVAFFAAAGTLLISSASTDKSLFRQLERWDPYYQRLPALVAGADLHNAVIFVPNSRNAPLGDYPFVPLDRANIVYFRTGPLPQWGLNTRDLGAAYRRYFSGRAAYLFDKSTLQRIEP